MTKQELQEIKKRCEAALSADNFMLIGAKCTPIVNADIPKLLAEIERLQALVDHADKVFIGSITSNTQRIAWQKAKAE